MSTDGEWSISKQGFGRNKFFTEMQYVTQVYSIRDVDSSPMDKYISHVGYDLMYWKRQSGDLEKFITYGRLGGKCGK